MKAHIIIKQNIDALLRSRGQTRRDLAQHVLQTLDRRADSWISHIFGAKGYHARVMPSQYLDRIGAFFGLEVYQLFQPGISPHCERRKGSERRVLADRRIIGRRQDLPTTPIRQVKVTPEDESLLADLHSLPHEKYLHVRAWIVAAKLSRNTESGIPLPPEPTPEVPPNAAPARPWRVVRKVRKRPK